MLVRSNLRIGALNCSGKEIQALKSQDFKMISKCDNLKIKILHHGLFILRKYRCKMINKIGTFA